MTPPPAVLFTDLDGTLLDHFTYWPGPAEAAIRRLQRSGIPVVFASAKTRSELRWWRRALGVTDPFIAENGGALDGVPDGPMLFGLPRAEVQNRLRRVSRDLGVAVRGYADMAIAEIADITGLDPEAAARAADREFSETFLAPEEPEESAVLQRALTAVGLRMIEGARFYTAQGDHDKGSALARLMGQWTEHDGTAPRAFAVGDHLNDVDMLAAADVPMLVERPGGGWADIEVPGLIRLEGIGPLGWCRAAEVVLRGV